MILDDLFKHADGFVQDGDNDINVECAYTTSHSGGLKADHTLDVAHSRPLLLRYKPAGRIDRHHSADVEVLPAAFSGPSIRIVSTGDEPAPGTYRVEMLETSFVPRENDETSTIYGTAGSTFVTISLCGLAAEAAP